MNVFLEQTGTVTLDQCEKTQKCIHSVSPTLLTHFDRVRLPASGVSLAYRWLIVGLVNLYNPRSRLPEQGSSHPYERVPEVSQADQYFTSAKGPRNYPLIYTIDTVFLNNRTNIKVKMKPINHVL